MKMPMSLVLLHLAAFTTAACGSECHTPSESSSEAAALTLESDPPTYDHEYAERPVTSSEAAAPTVVLDPPTYDDGYGELPGTTSTEDALPTLESDPPTYDHGYGERPVTSSEAAAPTLESDPPTYDPGYGELPGTTSTEEASPTLAWDPPTYDYEYPEHPESSSEDALPTLASEPPVHDHEYTERPETSSEAAAPTLASAPTTYPEDEPTTTLSYTSTITIVHTIPFPSPSEDASPHLPTIPEEPSDTDGRPEAPPADPEHGESADAALATPGAPEVYSADPPAATDDAEETAGAVLPTEAQYPESRESTRGHGTYSAVGVIPTSTTFSYHPKPTASEDASATAVETSGVAGGPVPRVVSIFIAVALSMGLWIAV